MSAETITCPTCGTSYPKSGLPGFGGMCPHCMLSNLTDEVAKLPGLAGTQIGRYTLIEEVGEGGMGSVWRARQDEPVQREVALKLIKLGMDTPELLSRFEAERQALAVLDHPNIAKIFDAGATETGRPYFVMELVDGVSITAFCERHELGIRERLELFMAVSGAIAHAHLKGIIHRDLKPSNILVSSHQSHQSNQSHSEAHQSHGEAHLKVIDFGVAKATSSDHASGSLLTRGDAMIGTPGYMSPEQATGDSDIDTRTDVYSLGALLYELLVGMPPFDAASLQKAGIGEILRIIREEDPPKPSTRITAQTSTSPNLVPATALRELRGDLDWIVMQALAKERERRYQSVEAFSEDIRRHLAHEPVSAAAPTLRYRFSKFARKHRSAMAAASIALVALIAGGTVATWQAVRATRAEADEKGARIEAQNRLASSYAATGFRHARSGDQNRAMLWFAKALATTRDPVERASHLVRLKTWSRDSFELLRAFRSSDPAPRILEFDPSGAFLIASADDGKALWDIAAEKVVPLADGAGIPYHIAWHPAGDRIAVWRRSGSVSLLSWPGLDSQLEIPARQFFTGEFNQDGSRLAVGGIGGFEVWATDEPRRLCRYQMPTGSMHSIILNRAGDRLIGTDYDKSVYAFAISDEQGGEIEPLFPPLPNRGDTVYQFVPGSDDFLIWGRFGGRVAARHELGSGKQVRQFAEIEFVRATSPADQPNRDLIVAGSDQADLWQARGELKRLSLPLDGRLSAAAFVPGRAEFIYGTDRGLIARHSSFSTSAALGALSHHRLTPTAIAVSPDGRLAAVASGGGLIRIFRLRRELDTDRKVVVGGHEHKNLALHPDGRHFATAGSAMRGLLMRQTQVFDLSSREPPESPLLKLGGGLIAAQFSPDGDTLVALTTQASERDAEDEVMFLPGGRGGNLELWDWRGGVLRGDPIPMPSEPRCVDFDPNDPTKLAVFCAGGQALIVDLRDRTVNPLFETGRSIPGRFRHNGAIAYSPDGTALVAYAMDASKDQGHVFVWDLATRKFRFPPFLRHFSDRCMAIDFHPSEAVFSTSSGVRQGTNFTRFWSLLDGREVAPAIAEPGWPFVGQFLDGGDRFLFGGRNRAAKVVDWSSGGAAEVTLRLNGSLLSSAAVPGHPSWMISTSGESHAEGFAYLWETRSGSLLAPPLFLDVAYTFDIAISPDAHQVVLAGTRLQRWDLSYLDDTELPLPIDDFIRLAELEAGSAALENGTGTDLDTDEWLKRWQAFRHDFPEHHQLPPKP